MQPHHAIITQVVSVLLDNPFTNYSMILSMVYEQNFSAAMPYDTAIIVMLIQAIKYYR